MGSIGKSVITGKSVSSYNNLEGFIGKGAIEDKINDELRHSLSYNEEYATVDDVSILSTPQEIEDNGGIAEVEARYTVHTRVPYTETDSDGYRYTTYEDDYEYRTRRFNIIVLGG